jgi:hypothetical protein
MTRRRSDSTRNARVGWKSLALRKRFDDVVLVVLRTTECSRSDSIPFLKERIGIGKIDADQILTVGYLTRGELRGEKRGGARCAQDRICWLDSI